MNTRAKKWTLRIIFFLIFAYFVNYTSVYRITENFYEVDPGKFYRSAQLAPDELTAIIDKYKIKTIISLRGAPTSFKWMGREVEIAKEKNVNFIDVGYTVHYFPSTEQLRRFANALMTAERPILVHCKTGSDRTGEATAVYAIEYMNEKNEEAINNHLNFKYWHVKMFHPAKAELVRQWKGLDWALKTYDLCSMYPQWAQPGDCPP